MSISRIIDIVILKKKSGFCLHLAGNLFDSTDHPRNTAFVVCLGASYNDVIQTIHNGILLSSVDTPTYNIMSSLKIVLHVTRLLVTYIVYCFIL